MQHVTCSFVHLKSSGAGPAKGAVAKGNQAKAPSVTQKQPRLAAHLALKVKPHEKQILLAQKPAGSLQAGVVKASPVDTRASSEHFVSWSDQKEKKPHLFQVSLWSPRPRVRLF